MKGLRKCGIYIVFTYNEILSFAGKWMELEKIFLSEVSQVQKAKGHMFSHVEYKCKQYYEKQVPIRGGQIQVKEGKRRKLRK
jgi:hypothetical protein